MITFAPLTLMVPEEEARSTKVPLFKATALDATLWPNAKSEVVATTAPPLIISPPVKPLDAESVMIQFPALVKLPVPVIELVIVVLPDPEMVRLDVPVDTALASVSVPEST